MKTTIIPEAVHHIAPDGAEIRELMSNHLGGIAHCILPHKQISKATRHKTVNEFWHILSGHGRLWRKQGTNEEITELTAGITVDIPVDTDFQYRSDQDDLVFIIVTMPNWPGPDEAILVDGIWTDS